MGQQDFDLGIAQLKKNIIDLQKKGEAKEEKALKNIAREKDAIQKVLNFALLEYTFFEGLFTMVLPENIFNEPLKEENMVFFQSQKEHIVLVVKLIQTDNSIDLEKLMTEYTQQMKKSKQQTKVDLSGSCYASLGEVYYFIATHSMPEEGQCDFIIVFKIEDNMVLMNFDFLQKDYVPWKTIIRTLLSTIKIGNGGDATWKK